MIGAIDYGSYKITGSNLVKMLKKATRPREVAWILMSIFAEYSGPFIKNHKEQDNLSAFFYNLKKNELDLFNSLMSDMKIITKSSPDWQSLLNRIYERCVSGPEKDLEISLNKVVFIFDGSITHQLYNEISQSILDLFHSHYEKVRRKKGGKDGI